MPEGAAKAPPIDSCTITENERMRRVVLTELSHTAAAFVRQQHIESDKQKATLGGEFQFERLFGHENLSTGMHDDCDLDWHIRSSRPS